MKFRNVDANNDWDWGKGLADYTSLNQAIGLNIKTRLQCWLNDCFFDQTAGVDWYTRLSAKNQRALLEEDMRRVILQSEGVTGLLSFDTILNGRNLTANFSVVTLYSVEYQNSITVGI